MKPALSIPSSRSRVEGVALLAVIALLGLLAVVQHRWLGAIAEGERRKLLEEAGEKAAAIAQDVDRELTRAFLELRIDAKALPGRRASAERTIVAQLSNLPSSQIRAGSGEPSDEPFTQQFERWRAESTHPDLVKSVFVAERSLSEPSRLRRFDPGSRTFVDEPWPAVLEGVRAAIDAQRDGPIRAFGLKAGSGVAFPVMTSLPTVMADVPALLSPVVDVVVSERLAAPPTPDKLSQIREMFLRHSGLGPVEIILLDAAYLRETVLAGVARERLGADSPFEWSVVKSADGEAVAGVAAAPGSTSDAKAPLLRLRFDDLEKSVLRGVLPGLSEVVSESSVRFVVQLGRPQGGALAGGNSGSIAPWTLQIRHREGSIDAAVRSQQRRNTALSASILGVLGLSAGLVFFSARRLRAIAARQVEFVASVSHELRTPLAVIRSAADNLADGVVQDKDQAKRYGALIRDESVRLTDMVEHVLEFAGADSPGRAARGPVDVAEAARAAIKGMESLAGERGASVTLDLPTEPVVVTGDLSHLTRAISNLLGNALKYGGEGPRVNVRVHRATEGVEVSVADGGAGLTPDEIPHLFEPFYRGQRASETHIPGSGLGLALVKRIVESHGGRVNAKNSPQGGALFAIVLPAS